jgi:hypothetical protein
MNRIIFIIIITVILSGCGKKSVPVYKSENLSREYCYNFINL